MFGAAFVHSHSIVSNAEDDTVTTTRIYFQAPITLTEADVGNYLVIDGLSLSSLDLQGLQTISVVNTVDNYVELVATSNSGHDFTATPLEGPFVRVLREVRFVDRSALASAAMVFAIGDLVWIDHDTNDRWAVLQWDGVSWDTSTIVRSQPSRTDPIAISETVIYEQGTKIIDQQMFIDEPIVDDVVVIDPLAGLIAGIADREIDFKTDYDPARYDAGAMGDASNVWGSNEIGRVWWDLSSVKFLDPFTDVIGVSDARDLVELAYRSANWSRIAPKTAVQVYEWIESNIDPLTYTANASTDANSSFGVVYNANNPSWVEKVELNPITLAPKTLYYFWVSGITTTPNVSFRHMDIKSVSLAIENPSALDLAWMAPVHQDALIVSGVSQFLDDIATVMKVRLTLNTENTDRHDEWLLLRMTDETSLPPVWLWDRLRDSLRLDEVTVHVEPC